MYDLLSFQSHTILLVQPNSRPDTRTYSDYESLNECLEGMRCILYKFNYTPLNEVVGGYTGFTMSVRL